jgi:hypothetical protein
MDPVYEPRILEIGDPEGSSIYNRKTMKSEEKDSGYHRRRRRTRRTRRKKPIRRRRIVKPKTKRRK